MLLENSIMDEVLFLMVKILFSIKLFFHHCRLRKEEEKRLAEEERARRLEEEKARAEERKKEEEEQARVAEEERERLELEEQQKRVELQKEASHHALHSDS